MPNRLYTLFSVYICMFLSMLALPRTDAFIFGASISSATVVGEFDIYVIFQATSQYLRQFQGCEHHSKSTKSLRNKSLQNNSKLINSISYRVLLDRPPLSVATPPIFTATPLI
jgi:hypothetical protein